MTTVPPEGSPPSHRGLEESPPTQIRVRSRVGTVCREMFAVGRGEYRSASLLLGRGVGRLGDDEPRSGAVQLEAKRELASQRAAVRVIGTPDGGPGLEGS